jgi:MFS family permease
MDRKKQAIFLGIFGATFISTFGESLPQSFAPLFLASLGITPSVIGLVYNIRNIMQTILRPLAGSLSDIVGRRKLMYAGLALLTFVPLIYSVSRDAWLPLVAMTVSGIGLSIYYPPSEAYASSLYPPEKTGEALGRYHMSWAISAIIGPSVGGLLTIFFPEYRPIFVLAGAVTGLSILVLYALTRDGEEKNNGAKMSGEASKIIRGFPSTARRMLANRRVFVGTLSVFAHSFCHWGLITFVPLFAAKAGYNEVAIGLSLTANALLMAVCLPVVGIISDKIGRFTPIVGGLLLSVVAFALIPSIQAPWMLAVLMGTLGLCATMEFPVSQAVAMEALPVKDRGAATGVWGMMMSLGGTVGMFVMSYIVSVAPIEWVFYFCAAFSLVAALLLSSLKGFFKA